MSDLNIQNRTTLVVSRLSFACLVFVLLLSLLQIGNYLTIRKARSRLELQHEITDMAFRRLVVESVRNEVSNIVSCLQLERISSNEVVQQAQKSKHPRFEPCSSLTTWVTPRNEVRAILNGVECGVGDYCEYGLVVSIRRGRVICTSDDGVVLVAATSGSRQADVPARPSSTSEAQPVDMPSW